MCVCVCFPKSVENKGTILTEMVAIQKISEIRSASASVM